MEVVSGLSYLGIFLAMVLESACIPLPSEVVMPFAGYLVAVGHLHFWDVIVAGTLGNVCGSLVAYSVGRYGGRVAIQRYGQLVRLSDNHLKRVDDWFANRGTLAVLVGRILPIIRTFISLPAGVAKMPVAPFVFFTAVGSFPWLYLLTWMGTYLGRDWKHIDIIMRPFTYIVGVAIAVELIIYFVKGKNGKPQESDPK